MGVQRSSVPEKRSSLDDDDDDDDTCCHVRQKALHLELWAAFPHLSQLKLHLDVSVVARERSGRRLE